MATTKITDLTAYTDPVSTDVLPIVDVTSDVTKKVSIADVMENAGSGSAAAPGISFDGDPNTGIYRPGADQIGITTGGTARLTASTTAITAAIPIDALLGSASTPSYTFTGDLNTGIYSPGADQLALATNGTNRLHIASDGKVGAGTTSPEQLLDVRGVVQIKNAGTCTLRFNDSTTNYWDIQNDSNLRFSRGGSEYARIDSSGRLGVGTSAPSTPLEIINGTDNSEYFRAGCSSSASTRSIRFSSATNTGGTTNARHIINAASTAGELLIQTASTNAVFIDSAQRVGIGTTSPGAPLQIGTISTNTYAIFDDGTNARLTFNGSTSTASLYATTTGFAAYEDLEIRSAATIFKRDGTNESARLDSSGRFLVGTSSSIGTANGFTPSVQVAGTSTSAAISAGRYAANANPPQLTLQKSRSGTIGSQTVVVSGDEVGQISFEGSDGSNFRAAANITAVVDGTPGANDMPGRLVFSTTADGASSPTERMRIANNGLLDTFSSNGSNTLSIRNSNTAGTTVNLITGLHTATSTQNGTLSFVVRTNGDVLNTNNSYGAISDIKLKENIVDASSQWDDLKALQVRNYNLKEGQTHTQIGLIAQEVELVSPGLVSESPDRDEEGNDLGTVTKSVNYSVLYMKAVKALQEAMERIEVLEQRLTDAGIA